MSMKRMTNAAFVADLMTFSKHGAMAQLFIMDAIGKWSDIIADTPIEELRAKFGENSFISADAWHGVATEIKAKMAANLA